jgi:predicted O-linked N-acetylglucosamine transferase (SPINDLY family)
MIPEALASAIQHHQAGRLQAAEQTYRQILAVDPNQVDAIHLLGLIAHQVGKHGIAVEYIRRAIALKGDTAAFHNNLGNALKCQRKLDEAIKSYRRALELNPKYAEAYNNLGAALNDQEKLDEAVACYRRALELKPNYAEARYNLGNALTCQGNLDGALACYREALQLNPDFAEDHNNMGNVLKDQGKLDEAVASYRRALELKPDHADTHINLGIVLKDRRKLDEAAACFRRALELKPDRAEAHNNLGNVLKAQWKLDEAIASYRRALALRPDYAGADKVHNNLGVAFMDQGRADEALEYYRQALKLSPDSISIHSNLLYALHYCAGVTPGALAEAHAEYDRRHAAPLRGTLTRREKVRDRQGPLRLGFVSPDLGRHPVGNFLVRVLENLDDKQHETVCYSDRIAKDDWTHRFQAAATQWRDVFGMDDQRLAEQIRADRIDILFDLTGHTAFNRLLVFARKPAPIQITWIGYEGTTGLAAMDYLIADRFVIPEGTERYYRERVLRMPNGYLCYDPPDAAPPVGPPPSIENGYATFGSFNNLAKITPEVVAVWAEILRRVPAARLILKYRGLADQTVKRRYVDLFAAQGVQPQRLELLPASSYAEYLATYHRVDVALDPFPFSGSVTTCEALWMGVPVVTCPLETFASRHSQGHLSNLGLTETIAHDLHEYVELAVSLAGDLSRLAGWRTGLRDRMAASPLCDCVRFATNLASMLHDVWENG